MNPSDAAGSMTDSDVGRFRDDSAGVWEFTDQDILVSCPNCGKPAVVRVVRRDESAPALSARELACDQCLIRRRSGSTLLTRGGPRDPFLRSELWLQTSCGNNTLWAFNEDHIEFIARVVGAKLRENAPGTYSSRLPTWILDRRHRVEVLKALDRLKARAAEHRALTDGTKHRR